MAKVIDCVSFNGEYDILEIRLNILNDFVDEFIIVEAPTTFTGKPKELYFEKHKARYAPWLDKIKYFVIDENYTPEEIALAENSPNTKGASHWEHEFLQKESLKKALTHLKDDDIVFVGDADEIWSKEALEIDLCQKLKLKVFTYYLNNRSNEEFWGGLFATYDVIRDNCLNDLRNNSNKTENYFGWHFTSLKDGLRRKLTDSYTKESYATDEVMNNLEKNIENNKDFLGRGFTFKTDESKLPKYLKEHRQQYEHLFK